jgi:hypothetical protein
LGFISGTKKQRPITTKFSSHNSSSGKHNISLEKIQVTMMGGQSLCTVLSLKVQVNLTVSFSVPFIIILEVIEFQKHSRSHIHFSCQAKQQKPPNQQHQKPNQAKNQL